MYKLAFALPFLFALLHVNPAYAVEVTGVVQIMDQNNKVIVKKNITFEEGDNIYDITKNNFDVTETNGMITGINGLVEKPTENIHWAAFIDGKFVEISPDDVGLYANDILTWALRDLDKQEIMK
ncbi:DUF4430 domain-containing protein [Heyndrickxia camelliae]|uniref:Transcobalamin-like C-terminal domain-containing protein n=1 Tax=Heyndrickxia camelliae TaxID=1707093 RepID=A0A2N3LGR0_9BACI|nr:DUF4430 domain-containing protein [Heyndrickxia camelliae]PKR83820.1 hypothetical protein CWO92_17615 [Heyndrickxia camelliae]